jgi:hypothetical protein
MSTSTRLLAAALALASLTACTQAAVTDATGDVAAADELMVDPMVDPIDGSGDTSMPAPADLERVEDHVTEGEAEAVATAYVGLTEQEAVAQAVVDGRDVRIGGVDGEMYGLTEDYLVGRITIELLDGTIVTATVESSDGPVTVIS